MAFKIGLLGEIRAGKDTVAQLLRERLPGDTVFFAFSDGIHAVLNMTMPEVYAEGKPRKQLQDVGQFFRSIQPNVWVNTLFNSAGYQYSMAFGDNIIITDVRQPNEVKLLVEDDYFIIKVVADKQLRLERARKSGDNFDPDMFEHETEKVIAECPFDFVIDNSEDLNELARQVNAAVETMKRKYRRIGGLLDE